MSREILIIEDNEDLRECLAEFLRLEGFAVRAVENGAGGLEVLGEWRPSAILLDLSTPVMNGRAFLLALREGRGEASRVPVIVTSFLEPPPGADGYLRKPFDLEDVVAEVRRVCDAPGTGPDRLLPSA